MQVSGAERLKARTNAARASMRNRCRFSHHFRRLARTHRGAVTRSNNKLAPAASDVNLCRQSVEDAAAAATASAAQPCDAASVRRARCGRRN